MSPLATADTGLQVSGDGVAMRDGDFVVSELAKVLDREHLNRDIARQIDRLGQDRQRWLVYASTVQHAGHLAEALRGHGHTAAVVSAETPKAERERLIRDFRTGRLRALKASEQSRFSMARKTFLCSLPKCSATLRELVRAWPWTISTCGRRAGVLGVGLSFIALFPLKGVDTPQNERVPGASNRTKTADVLRDRSRY